MRKILIVICIALAVWGWINLFTLIFGINNKSVSPTKCDPPFSRLNTYVMPGYKLGCWLGEPVEENK